ncbi:MAG: TonB-dependent receptor [Gammaproteobacteria bacterium]
MPLNPVRIAYLLLPACLAIANAIPCAVAAGDPAEESVEVIGTRDRTSPFAPTVTRVEAEDISRRAPRDLYDVLSTVPGVAIDGGPRASGKTLSIRGFSDTEDVLIRIDGAGQNFEKYRYGSGLDIDPTLVRQVDVLRGARTLTQGAGALGGVVLVETVNAQDLLDDERRFGASARLGFTSNDDGQQRSLALFGRPAAHLDLLGSVVSRDTRDFELPDGTRLADSAQGQLSGLLKAVLMREWGDLGITYRHSDDERLEPFDATGGAAGIGGTVRRAIIDESLALRGALSPGSRWLDARWTLAHNDKEVRDLDSQLAGGAALGTDTFAYSVWTFDLRNTSRMVFARGSLRAEFGVQGTRETRQARRTNRFGTIDNQTQPPGRKESWGAFFAPTLRVGDLTLDLAARIDRVRVTARSTSAELLKAQGRAHEITFSRVSPAVTLTYATPLPELEVFYGYFEAFRPPLVDEYFTIGALSRCQSFSRFAPPPTAPLLPIAPAGPPAFGAFPDLTSFLAALDAYLRALDAFNLALKRYFADLDAFLVAVETYPTNPDAQPNALCGDDYEPEVAHTHEAGLSWTPRELLLPSDLLATRLAYFETRVEGVLESIFEHGVTGAITQPGREIRRGIELAIDYSAPRWFWQFSLSTLGGHSDLRYFDDNVNPLVADFTTSADRGRQDLRDVPGNRLNLTAGHRAWGDRLEFGYRLTAIAARRVTVGFKDGCPAGFFVLPACTLTGKQAGYVLHGAFARWSITPNATLRLSAENLTNKSYELPGFAGGPGTVAPGRDIRVTFDWRY